VLNRTLGHKIKSEEIEKITSKQASCLFSSPIIVKEMKEGKIRSAGKILAWRKHDFG
jgi:hypothetical protein